MDIEHREIKSDANPRGEYPWYELEVDGDELVITADKDGGRADGPDSLENASLNLTGQVTLPEESAVTESGDVTYAVTEDGEFISFDPRMEMDVPRLRAHLAWYTEGTDTLTVLKFVADD